MINYNEALKGYLTLLSMAQWYLRHLPDDLRTQVMAGARSEPTSFELLVYEKRERHRQRKHLQLIQTHEVSE